MEPSASPQTARRSAWRIAGIALVALLLAWGWIDVRGRAIPDRGREGQRTDLTVYLAAAQALRDGGDLYEARNVRNWPYLYPPLPAVLFVPLTHFSRGMAAFVWFLVSLGALGACVLLMRAALRRVDPALAGRAAWMGLLAASLPALHTLQRGQINALVLLCVCAGLYALARRRDVLAGASLAMAAALKVTPGFVLVYLLGKWVQQQARMVRAGQWAPRRVLAGSGATLGFAGGLGLGLFVLPALYMGPGRTIETLSDWRRTVTGGYLTAGQAGHIFADTRGIHDMNDKNQTWYRAIAGYATWLDRDAMASRDLLAPAWQGRVRWVLLATAAGLTAILLGLSRGEWFNRTSPALYAEAAAFGWLGLSLGKIAWHHFYVMALPLWAVAWLAGRQLGDRPAGRLVRRAWWTTFALWLLHYAVFVPAGLGRYGTMLLPTAGLALAAVWAANRAGTTAESTEAPDGRPARAARPGGRA